MLINEEDNVSQLTFVVGESRTAKIITIWMDGMYYFMREMPSFSVPSSLYIIVFSALISLSVVFSVPGAKSCVSAKMSGQMQTPIYWEKFRFVVNDCWLVGWFSLFCLSVCVICEDFLLSLSMLRPIIITVFPTGKPVCYKLNGQKLLSHPA